MDGTVAASGALNGGAAVDGVVLAAEPADSGVVTADVSAMDVAASDADAVRVAESPVAGSDLNGSPAAGSGAAGLDIAELEVAASIGTGLISAGSIGAVADGVALEEPGTGSNPAVIGEPGYGGTESGALFDVDMPVRLPSAISPSRAGDFMQCPLLFRLRVVDKVPEPPNAAATRGTLVHAVLDRLFDLPAGGRTPDEAAALLQPEWDRLLAKTPGLAELFATPEDLAEWLASAKSLVGMYFTLEDPNRLEPAEREWFVRTVVGDGDDRFVLHGVVDRLDVAPNGLLRVVDYKTGKAPPAAYEAKNLFQMKFYALVLWKLRGVVPKRLQLIFLGSGEVLTYDPDERDLRGVERKITAVWAAIRAAAQRREWPPSPSRLCDWCSFKDGCPAHGGEVAPAPIVEFTPVPSGNAGAS